MVNWPSRGECPLKSFGSPRRRINLSAKPKVSEEKGRQARQGKADSCKKQPRREVRRDQTSFSRAPPRIARRFFLRGKKLTSGSDWQKNRSLLLRSGCLPDSVVRFLLPIWRVASLLDALSRRTTGEKQTSLNKLPCIFLLLFPRFELSAVFVYIIVSYVALSQRNEKLWKGFFFC